MLLPTLVPKSVFEILKEMQRGTHITISAHPDMKLHGRVWIEWRNRDCVTAVGPPGLRHSLNCWCWWSLPLLCWGFFLITSAKVSIFFCFVFSSKSFSSLNLEAVGFFPWVLLLSVSSRGPGNGWPCKQNVLLAWVLFPHVLNAEIQVRAKSGQTSS